MIRILFPLRFAACLVVALAFGLSAAGPGFGQDPADPTDAAAAVDNAPVADDAPLPPGSLPGEPGGDMEKVDPSELPTIEFTDEEKQWIEEYEAQRDKLADSMMRLREIFVRYANEEDRSPAAVKSYREARDETRTELNATYDAALDLLRRIPYEPAAGFVLTTVQHREERDIYDADTAEGAARLIDGGVNYTFLFLAGARSAVVSGQFDLAKKIYEPIEEESLEKSDRSLKYQLDKLKENWEREQKFLEADAKNDQLPRVLVKTTRGDFVIELFLDQAPSTVSHFIQLVDEGFYDGLDFYQVIDNLLALTGDPSGNGSGNAGRFLVDEQNENSRPPMRGSLMLAKIPVGESGKFVPNTGSSQFTILFLPLIDSLGQTVFGRIIEGMDVVSSLRRVDPSKEKEKNKVVVPPDRILSAEVIRRPEKLPDPVYATQGK